MTVGESRSSGAGQALEDLGVSGNELRALPQSIGRLSSLKKLACNGNLLEELPESVGELAGLQQLWLQCNKLRRIDPVSKLQVWRLCFSCSSLLGSAHRTTVPLCSS